MVVIRGLNRFRPDSRPTAVGIGNFDGVHLGHRKILACLLARSRSRGLRPLVLTFFPHPERVLRKKRILMIQSLDQRLEAFEGEKIETVIVTPFDTRFSTLSAESFVAEVLKEKLGAAEIVVGRNFRFGKDREGGSPLLRTLAPRYKLGVRVVPPKFIDGRVVSSSSIRTMLGRGRVKEAARFLGRPYEISGTVVRGRSRGKALGFPTANLSTENEILPQGVFLTRTSTRGSFLPSLTSIGTSPTFHDGVLAVETYILDFEKSLYGHTLAIRFIEKIRPIRAFRDPAGLVAGMMTDLARARAFFGSGPS